MLYTLSQEYILYFSISAFRNVAVRNSGSVGTHQPVTDVSPLSNMCQDLKEHHDKEDEDAQASSHLLSQKAQHDIPEPLRQNVQDGVHTFRTCGRTLESKEASVQPCTLGNTIASVEM